MYTPLAFGAVGQFSPITAYSGASWGKTDKPMEELLSKQLATLNSEIAQHEAAAVHYRRRLRLVEAKQHQKQADALKAQRKQIKAQIAYYHKTAGSAAKKGGSVTTAPKKYSSGMPSTPGAFPRSGEGASPVASDGFSVSDTTPTFDTSTPEETLAQELTPWYASTGAKVGAVVLLLAGGGYLYTRRKRK